MIINRIAEILRADGTSGYENVTSKPQPDLSSLSRIYNYTANQRATLEETLNYLGLQELLPNLDHAEAFVYLTTDAPLENLQKEAAEKGSKVVGYIEIFSISNKETKLPEDAQKAFEE